LARAFQWFALDGQYAAIDPQNQVHSIEGNPGEYVGLITEYSITNSISLGVEPGYSYMKFSYNVNHSDSFEHEYSPELAYIEIPVILKYRYYNNSPFVPTVYAGAVGRIMVPSFEKSDDLGNYWLTAATEPSNGILSCFLVSTKSMGLLGGAGVDFNLKNSSISLDVRYIYNMPSSGNKSKFDPVTSYSDISNSEQVYYTDHIGLITLSTLQVSVGFRYFLNYKVF